MAGPSRAAAVGGDLLGQLRLLDRHFALRRRRGLRFPLSAGERLMSSSYQDLGQASGAIRRHFLNVDVAPLTFDCAARLPGGRRGAEILGEAAAGSRHFTIGTDCFRVQPDNTQRGTVLHEAFHANFQAFGHDSYFHESSYPGTSPLTNADSYSSFAERVATGGDPRTIVCGPTTTITASPSAGSGTPNP